jgi:hypothetical protein
MRSELEITQNYLSCWREDLNGTYSKTGRDQVSRIRPIEYNGDLKVHTSLLDVVFHESPPHLAKV